MKKLNFILCFVLCAVCIIQTSCAEQATKNDDAKPVYILCENSEGGYLDTVNLKGRGYLFLNSIPNALVADLRNVAFAVYFPKQDSAIFQLSNSDAGYYADICNFPDYAKHWEIPLNGKAFLFEGEFYEEGRYLSMPPVIGGKIVLTEFKSK